MVEYLLARTFNITGISAERGIARLDRLHDLSVERINLGTKLVDEFGPALVAALLHQPIQFSFIIADDSLNSLTRGVAWLPHRRDRSRKLLLIKLCRLQDFLARGSFFRFKVTDFRQSIRDLTK